MGRCCFLAIFIRCKIKGVYAGHLGTCTTRFGSFLGRKLTRCCGAAAPSRLPCVKGAVILHLSKCKMTEGLCSKKWRIRVGFRRNGNIVPQQPLSQKSDRFLTAPLTQGSLWALPRQCHFVNFLPCKFTKQITRKSCLPVPGETALY